MNGDTRLFFGGPVFTGTELLHGHCVVFENGRCSSVQPHVSKPDGKQLPDAFQSASTIDLQGDILSLGYADLQVNGGGGVLFNDDPGKRVLETISSAHRSLGTTCFLPTLITSTAENTSAAIDAVNDAMSAGVSGLAGLHLEGPHLSVEKKGAHEAALIRPMDAEDLNLLLAAAKELPVLKVTIAPENVSLEQVQTLARAGVLVALGHTNASYATCMAYHEAGAKSATHLFNAMSQFGSRDPGLVGAVLDSEGFSAGLIADGVHVHAATIRTALKSMGGMHRVFLVSDGMAPAGTSINSFSLEGRTIQRCNGRLTLEDGTLAGADLELTAALHFLVNEVQVDLVDALRSVVTVPRNLLGNTHRGVSIIGARLENCITISSRLDQVSIASTSCAVGNT